jgi:NADH-quinone oxidoreductase subunit J
MTGEFIAFILLATASVLGGILLINFTKVVHMLLAAVLTFVSLAGLYILLSAEFVAGVQVLIYSGAVTIMMLFGIMLTKHNDQSETSTGRIRKLLVFAGMILFAGVIYYGIYHVDFGQEAETLHENNTEQIGISLFSEYIIPFELTSIILLAALIGAIVLAKKEDKEEGAEEK